MYTHDLSSEVLQEMLKAADYLAACNEDKDKETFIQLMKVLTRIQKDLSSRSFEDIANIKKNQHDKNNAQVKRMKLSKKLISELNSQVARYRLLNHNILLSTTPAHYSSSGSSNRGSCTTGGGGFSSSSSSSSNSSGGVLNQQQSNMNNNNLVPLYIAKETHEQAIKDIEARTRINELQYLIQIKHCEEGDDGGGGSELIRELRIELNALLSRSYQLEMRKDILKRMSEPRQLYVIDDTMYGSSGSSGGGEYKNMISSNKRTTMTYNSIVYTPQPVDWRDYQRCRGATITKTKSQIRSDQNELARLNQEKMNNKYLKRENFCLSILNHQREFVAAYAQRNKLMRRLMKEMKANLEAAERLSNRDTNRMEVERIEALKSNNMEAYEQLVKQTHNDRLKYLLSQTDEYLSKIGSLVAQRKEVLRDDEEDGSDSDDDISAYSGDESDSKRKKKSAGNTLSSKQSQYFNLAHSVREVVQQPSMLVGGTLKPYQLTGLQWMVSLYNGKLNGILADEMGLGKTIQTIALITYLIEYKHNNGPYLIVVPLSTLSNWVNELEKWAPDVVKVVFKGSPNVRKNMIREEVIPGRFNVLLTTYEFIMIEKKYLKKPNWQYIIVDEGHRMKNSNSKFSQTLGTEYDSRNRILLTGTPLQNSLPELWALMNFLLPTIFNSIENFEQWFSQPFQNFSGGSGGSMGAANVQISMEEKMLVIQRLHSVLRPFLLRRTKKEVLNQLPKKVEKVIRCDLSGWQKIVYKQIKEQGAVITRSGGGGAAARGLSNILMQLRKVCNHPYLFSMEDFEIGESMIRSSGKFELLDRVLPKLRMTGHRVLIFSQMTTLMDLLEHYFRYRNHLFLRLDGNTSADDREKRMFQFNAPDSPYFAFLLSTRAGGLGINLATADTVIIFDSDWNPQMDAQAQDRAHRIGQRNEVRVLRFITNTPVEERILARANDKLSMESIVIGAGRFNEEEEATTKHKGSGDAKTKRQAMIRELLSEDLDEEEASNEISTDDKAMMNEILARDENELKLFEQVDIITDTERARRHEQYCFDNDLDPVTTTMLTALMTTDEVPSWVTDTNAQARLNEAGGKMTKEVDVVNYGRGTRQRAVMSYADNMTDDIFQAMLESGASVADFEAAQKELLEKSMARGRRKRNRIGGLALEDLKVELEEVMETILNAKNEEDEERVMCDLFLDLPSHKLYPDYYDVIKEPMALNTILENINNMKYTTPEEFDHDVSKVFQNALSYNQRGTWVYEDAMKLRRVHKKTMMDLFGLHFYSLMHKGGPSPDTKQQGVKKKRRRRRKVEEIEEGDANTENGLSLEETAHEKKEKLERERRERLEARKNRKRKHLRIDDESDDDDDNDDDDDDNYSIGGGGSSSSKRRRKL